MSLGGWPGIAFVVAFASSGSSGSEAAKWSCRMVVFRAGGVAPSRFQFHRGQPPALGMVSFQDVPSIDVPKVWNGLWSCCSVGGLLFLRGACASPSPPPEGVSPRRRMSTVSQKVEGQCLAEPARFLPSFAQFWPENAQNVQTTGSEFGGLLFDIVQVSNTSLGAHRALCGACGNVGCFHRR